MRNRERRYNTLAASAPNTTIGALLYGAIDAELKFALANVRPMELRELADWRARAVFGAHSDLKAKFELALRSALKNQKHGTNKASRTCDVLVQFGNLAIVEIMAPVKVWYHWVIGRSCKTAESCIKCNTAIHFPAALPPIPARSGCRCFAVPVVAM